MRRVFLVISLTIFLFALSITTALASSCGDCHTQFVSNTPQRSTECFTCHGTARHANWTDENGNISYSEFIPGRGYFKAADSWTQSGSVLHAKHDGNNKYAAIDGCNKCHLTTSCTSCHTEIPHIQHSSTGTPEMPPSTAPIYPQATGTSAQPLKMSCALSQCHQPLPNVVTTTSDGKSLCSNCHSISGHEHQIPTNSFEPASDLECLTCHSTDRIGNTSELVNLHQSALGTAFRCELCHNSIYEGPGKVILKDGSIDMKQLSTSPIYCSNCHSGLPGMTPLKDSKHAPEHAATSGLLNMDCSNCHSFSLNNEQPTNILSLHSAGCNTCHGLSANNEVRTFVNNRVGLNNNPYECENCHTSLHAGWQEKHKPVLPETECANCHTNDLLTEHLRSTNQPQPNTAIGYEVRRSTDGTNWTTVGKTTATQFSDCNLNANTKYYYQFVAYDGKPNYSSPSDIASGVTLTNNSVVNTIKPDIAVLAAGNNGDTSADPSSSSNVLTALTDTKTTTFATAKEAGTNDQYLIVTLKQDAKDYDKIELQITSAYLTSSNLRIYPYTNTGSVNTDPSVIVNGPLRSSSSKYVTDTIDVTQAARSMQGQNLIKFRIKPDPAKTASINIATLQLVVSKNAVSGGTVTNPPGDLPTTPEDSIAPTKPINLMAKMANYDRIDLLWSPSTDTTVSAASGEQNACVICHGPSVSEQVKTAVRTNNATCTACHLVVNHNHPISPANYESTATVNCSGCHSTDPVNKSAELVKLHESSLGSSFSCAICHNDRFTGPGKVIVNDGEIDMKAGSSLIYCNSCHNGTLAPAKETSHSAEHSAKSTIVEPVNCASCHSSDPKVATNTVSLHTDCNTCHNSTVAQVNEYITSKTGQTNTTYECEACHNYLPVKHQPEHLTKVGNYTFSCNSCHSFNLNNSYSVTSIHTKSGCNTCHSGANTSVVQQTTNQLINDLQGKTNAVYDCSVCHSTIHATINQQHNVLEATTNIDATSKACVNCHNAKRPGFANLTNHTGGCATCHSSTNTLVKSAITKGTIGCINCHQQNGPLAPHSVSAHSKITCKSCHVAENTDFTSSIHGPKGSNSTCTDCHRSTAKTNPFTFSNPYTNSVDLTDECSACHGNKTDMGNGAKKGCVGCHVDPGKSMINGNPYWGHYLRVKI